MRPELTQELLLQLLRYDPDTGVFTRRGGVFRGQQCGCVGTNGYRYMEVARHKALAHRLAWLYMYGHLPPNDLDHINGNRDDNRIANLREATRSENLAGKAHRNRHGHKGVVRHIDPTRKKPFGAYITRDYQQTFLGWFATAAEAGAAYQAAAKEVHGRFAK